MESGYPQAITFACQGVCSAVIMIIIWANTMPEKENMDILKLEWPDQAKYMEYNYKMYVVESICFAVTCCGFWHVIIGASLVLGVTGF